MNDPLAPSNSSPRPQAINKPYNYLLYITDGEVTIGPDEQIQYYITIFSVKGMG